MAAPRALAAFPHEPATPAAAPASALLLGSGPLLGRLSDALRAEQWLATCAADVDHCAAALHEPLPHAIILHAVDLREAGALLSDLRRVESVRGIPLLAVLAESPNNPEDLPAGADAYLIDPSPEDLLEALGQHVLTTWSRNLGGQHALDILESLEDAVFVVDRARRVLYHNPSGLALVHRISRHNAPILGAHVERLMPALEEARAQAALHAGLEHGDTSHVELGMGALRLSLAVFPNPDGATLIARDVTARHKLEEALLETRMRLARSEKVAFLGELVSGVAHEVRTPLVYLGNHLELIRGGMRRFVSEPSPENAEKIELDLDQAWAAWERAVRIMKELQRITRMDPTVRARVDVSEATREALTLFAAIDRRAAHVHADLQPGLFVDADVRKLQQVVLNLLQNAVEATEDGRGAVRVTSRACGESRVELVVQDEGAGMAQDVVDRMYDPLFTTKQDGTGLGLGVVHRVVQGHGGTIRCDTAPGRGTSFTIELPLIQEESR